MFQHSTQLPRQQGAIVRESLVGWALPTNLCNWWAVPPYNLVFLGIRWSNHKGFALL